MILNPFPAKVFVPLVKISSKNRLSQNFCWPEVFVSKTLLQFGVHEKWELRKEIIRRPTDMQEPLLQRTSSDVIMAVNGLTTAFESECFWFSTTDSPKVLCFKIPRWSQMSSKKKHFRVWQLVGSAYRKCPSSPVAYR